MATATSSSDDGRPELYRLAGYGRWSSTDLRGVNDRLVYLSEMIQSDSSREQQQQQRPASDTRTNGSEKTAAVQSSSNAIKRHQEALSELCYADTFSGRTALHIMCYWRPAPQVIDKFLTMATPELVWAKTDAGETALHMACSNATRMASADAVELILKAAAHAKPSSSSSSSSSSSADASRSRREYAMITNDYGQTALHCAAQADAPLSVLQVLLDAAPEAANIMDCSIGSNKNAADEDSGAVTGRIPLDFLTKSYELFISSYLDFIDQDNDPEADVEEESSDVEAAQQISDTSDASDASWMLDPATESLRHFWEKAALLIQASARHCRGRRINGARTSQSGCSGIPILHASLITATFIPFPSLLLRLVTTRCLHQAKEIDAHGNFPLHYAAQGLSSGHIETGIVQTLLREHQATARARNEDNLLPLQLLLPPPMSTRMDSGVRIDDVIRDLVRAYPPALFCCGTCPDYLVPCVLGKLGRQHAPNDDTFEVSSDASRKRLFSNVYELLRSKPELLANAEHR